MSNCVQYKLPICRVDETYLLLSPIQHTHGIDVERVSPPVSSERPLSHWRPQWCPQARNTRRELRQAEHNAWGVSEAEHLPEKVLQERRCPFPCWFPQAQKNSMQMAFLFSFPPLPILHTHHQPPSACAGSRRTPGTPWQRPLRFGRPALWRCSAGKEAMWETKQGHSNSTIMDNITILFYIV